MIDFAKITVKAGNGGSGSGSFEHIKGKRRSKANGGNGGRGGNVYFEATDNLNTLEPFRFIKLYSAENGGKGLSKRCKGAEGQDLVIKMPVGTQITTQLLNSTQTYDLQAPGQKILIARGGQGGRGNSHLRDEFGRRPFQGEIGQSGEQLDITLELKLIAQVGLIGLPNAGKSTLLSALTAATPKIADYPFTTLEPNLGVMEPKIIIADIPGLIEGASQGKGLGDLFLRHVERTKVLVHLVDATSKEHAFSNYHIIRNELKDYSKELAKKREVIVVNKIDLANQKDLEDIKNQFTAKRKKVYPVSAKTGQGLKELRHIILAKARPNREHSLPKT